MATKKDSGGQCRQHYELATTGKVPGVGSVGSGKSTAQNFKKGGRAKPAKRGR